MKNKTKIKTKLGFISRNFQKKQKNCTTKIPTMNFHFQDNLNEFIIVN